MSSQRKALVLGAYEKKDGDKKTIQLTKNAEQVNAQINGNLIKTLDIVGPVSKGDSRVLYNLLPDYDVLSVVGLGSPDAGYNELEEINEAKDNVRAAVAAGVRSVRKLNKDIEFIVDIDDCQDAASAAEGGFLSVYSFDELKAASSRKKPVKLQLFRSSADLSDAWRRGETLACGQNITRRLMELPANYCTPTIFAENCLKLAESSPKMKVVVRDRDWAEKMKMGSFLSVARGSDVPPKFVEIHYNNRPDVKPIVFVGKGITFDSGGTSLKPSLNMDKMRADMGGAANVIGTIWTLANLGAEVNVIGLTPLTENLSGAHATLPGDVVTAMNGKTIQVDNTDAEGRLVLADALCYADSFEPQLVMDIATLTGAISVALGPTAAGAYATNKNDWELLRTCGSEAGDRLWRMPLFNFYTRTMIENSPLADINNIGGGGKGGSPLAAAFLREFVKCPRWIHLDIASVMEMTGDVVPYLSKGMAGRPCRALVQFIESSFK